MCIMFYMVENEGAAREPLLKGMTQYRRPPCSDSYISASFDVENIIYFFTQTATLKRRSTVLISLPLHLEFPGACTIKLFTAVIYRFL
jgi:hypothetical protein